MSDAFLPLSSIREADMAFAGGKAARLGAAMARGERVPDGFVIGAEVLEAMLKKSGLEAVVADVLARVRRDAPGWEEAATALSERVLELTWPATFQSDLMRMLARFSPGLWAVRSSGTLEDGETASAAGLFESLLSVPPNDVIKAATRCWAASFQPRVFAHLLATGQDPAKLRMPLLVQVMVKPRLAGVAFTTDPDDPDRAHMRVAVAEGLGEAVVQGEAGTDLRLPRRGAVGAHPAIEARLARRLRAMALRLERRFGRALDLEWAAEGGRLWLLQARPIAELPPGAEARPAIRWSRDLAEERFPDPISPLGWTALESALAVNMATLDRRFGLKALRPSEVATVIGGYVYNNRDFFAIPRSLRFRPAAHLPYLGGYMGVLGGLLAPWRWGDWLKLLSPRKSALGGGPRDPRFRAVAGLFEAYVFRHADEVEQAWTRDFEPHLAAMDALSAEDPSLMAVPELIDYAHRIIARSDAFMEPDLAIYVIKMACRWALEELCALVDGEASLQTLQALTGGLAANATLEMNEALERLYQEVAGDARLAAALQKGSPAAATLAWAGSPAEPSRRAFLAAYGHLTLSWDIRQPTYGERPALLDDVLARRLAAPSHQTPTARRAELAAEREAEADRLAAALGDPWAVAFFRRLLATLQTFMALDEEHHLFCGKLIPAERRLISALAGRLIGRGAFDQPDDIYFLTLQEVFALAEEESPHSRRRLVARRRLAFERAIAQRPPEEVRGTRPVLATQRVPQVDGALSGQPASPGVAEGVCRLVSTMADMQAFQPGEILVVPTPKPCFTPLFSVAAGLVAGRGSTLSHGLISAREYGLPAVTEVHDAMSRLKTGQRIRIDGATGAITPLSSAPIRLPRLKGGPR
ncbi:MAG: PEP/pyruvate-binding domain-containing protein [Candidatus Sericytochromatia bacterium]